MTALEKGTGFELKVAELFKQKGYHVTHNIKMTGRSGVTHQIDVLAQFIAPLHRSSIIIETKSHQSNIDKDIIMKLIQIQQDLSIDRAILVTTSEFTSGALQTAQQYPNVELWNRKKITNLLGEIQLLDTSDGINSIQIDTIKVIKPKITLDDARAYGDNIAQKRSKGGFLGRGAIKEKFLAVQRIFYPYYDVSMTANIHEIEKTGWFSKEQSVKSVSSRTGVDGNTGAIIDVVEDGISYNYSYLNNLSEEEIYLLYYTSNVKAFEKRNLSSIGWTAGKIAKVVNSLNGKGLLVEINNKPITYRTAHPYPKDPSIFHSLMEMYTVTDETIYDKKIENTFPAGNIPTAFSRYWSGCTVNAIDLVYYPYYALVFEREDGTKRLEVLDGIHRTRQEYLEKIISMSDVS